MVEAMKENYIRQRPRGTQSRTRGCTRALRVEVTTFAEAVWLAHTCYQCNRDTPTRTAVSIPPDARDARSGIQTRLETALATQ
ncbi:MAG: hypothetical protein ACI9W2_000109 [Gammaproteobacteria bacterium]|jgi:hypothetical protein